MSLARNRSVNLFETLAHLSTESFSMIAITYLLSQQSINFTSSGGLARLQALL